MSDIKIGGFQINDPGPGQIKYPSSQSENAGIILPRMFYVSSNGRKPRKDEIISAIGEQTTFSLIKNTLAEESVKNLSKVNFKTPNRPIERDLEFKIDVNFFYNKLTVEARKIPKLVNIDAPNFGKLLSGNLQRTISWSLMRNKPNNLVLVTPKFGVSFYDISVAQRYYAIVTQYTLDNSIELLHKGITAKRTLNTTIRGQKTNADIRLGSKFISCKEFSTIKYVHTFVSNLARVDELEGSLQISDNNTNFDTHIYKEQFPASLTKNFSLNNVISTYNQKSSNKKCDKPFGDDLRNEPKLTLGGEQFYAYNTEFVHDYINLLFIVYFNDLKLKHGPKLTEIIDYPYKYIVYEYLINLIYYAIKKEDIAFDVKNILKLQFNEKKDKTLNELEEFLRLKLSANFVNYYYGDIHETKEYTEEEFNNIPESFRKIYEEVIALPQTKEFLTTIYYASTFIGKINNNTKIKIENDRSRFDTYSTKVEIEKDFFEL